MQNINSTLQVLLVRFNGKVLIPLESAVESIGIHIRTARNKLSKGTFPIPTVLVLSRRYIHISDLANYVESCRVSPVVVPKSKIVKKGARTKEERLKEQGRV